MCTHTHQCTVCCVGLTCCRHMERMQMKRDRRLGTPTTSETAMLRMSEHSGKRAAWFFKGSTCQDHMVSRKYALMLNELGFKVKLGAIQAEKEDSSIPARWVACGQKWNCEGCVSLETVKESASLVRTWGWGGHWWCLLPEKVLWGQNLGILSSSCQTTEVFPFLPERWGLVFFFFS